MLDNFVVSINITAKSLGKNESGAYEESARFGAGIGIDGSCNTNKTTNPDIYNKNKEETRLDFSKFEGNIEDFSEDIFPAVNRLVEKFKRELEQELAKQ